MGSSEVAFLDVADHDVVQYLVIVEWEISEGKTVEFIYELLLVLGKVLPALLIL